MGCYHILFEMFICTF